MSLKDTIVSCLSDPAVIVAADDFNGLANELHRVSVKWNMADDVDDAYRMLYEFEDWSVDSMPGDVQARWRRKILDAMRWDIFNTDWEPPDYGVRDSDFYHEDRPRVTKFPRGVLYGRDAF